MFFFLTVYKHRWQCSDSPFFKHPSEALSTSVAVACSLLVALFIGVSNADDSVYPTFGIFTNVSCTGDLVTTRNITNRVWENGECHVMDPYIYGYSLNMTPVYSGGVILSPECHGYQKNQTSSLPADNCHSSQFMRDFRYHYSPDFANMGQQCINMTIGDAVTVTATIAGIPVTATDPSNGAGFQAVKCKYSKKAEI